MKSEQLAHGPFCALRAVFAGEPSCWKMNLVAGGQPATALKERQLSANL